MSQPSLTTRQQQVVWLRYVNNASIDQIASWLRITRRAVFLRLRNARDRGVTPETAAHMTLLGHKPRRRLYTASQLQGVAGAETLNLDNV
jgi:predicted DNA-binding protein YlxM (UPF0122 family)